MYDGTDPSKLFDHHDGIAGSFVCERGVTTDKGGLEGQDKLPVARISGGFSQPSVV